MFDGEKTGAEAVVDIMVVISDVIGDAADLAFKRGEVFQIKVKFFVEVFEVGAADFLYRAVVFDGGFNGFPGEIEAGKFGVAHLKLGHDFEGINVMVEAAEARHGILQRPFSGMAERRVSEVVRQSNGFAEFFIEAKAFAQCAGYLRHFNAVGEAGAVVAPLMVGKDLGFAVKPPE